VRIAFIFGSIPTRNDKETDLQRAVIEKKDWLGQEAEYVAAALDRRHPGSDVSIHIMYPIDAEVESNGVTWYATKPPNFMLHRYFYQGKQWSRRWMKKILDWKPDLIHWQMNSYAYTFHLAARGFVKADIPYVYQHHGPYLARKKRLLAVLKFPNRRAERGIYLTKHHEKEYREGLGLDESKNVIIPVGYDPKFRLLDREKCRQKTGFKGDPTLFWCAGMSKRKDPIILLKAFERVVKDYPSAHFYLAGYGPLDDELKALVASSELLSKHATLLGYVNNDDVPEMSNASDIFVMGSYGEGFAVASMEAMACGLFPVLTTIPCFIEQTHNGKLGHLFDPGDLDGCTECLRKAIGDVEHRESVRKQLPEIVSKMTWEYSADRLVDLYEGVLDIKPTTNDDQGECEL